MKAYRILRDLQNQLKEFEQNHPNIQAHIIVYGGGERMAMLDEAIKELEELQNRSCNGCKDKDIFTYDCIQCSRHYGDRFEPKE